MASLLDSLMSQVQGGDLLDQLANQVGADSGATGSAVQAAVPAMIASLAHNASAPEGAEALAGALGRHDGAVLDQIGGGVDAVDTDDGAKIVNHMFGDKQSAVTAEISKASGLPLDAIGKLLPMLAPIVMGMLGRRQREADLGAGDVASMLGDEAKSARSAIPGLGGLFSMLDRDGDGNPLDDIVEMASGAASGASGGASTGKGGAGGLLGKVLGGLFKKR